MTFNELIIVWLKENWPQGKVEAYSGEYGSVWLERKFSRRWEIAAIVNSLAVQSYIKRNGGSYWGRTELSPCDPSYILNLKRVVGQSWDLLGTFGERFQ